MQNEAQASIVMEVVDVNAVALKARAGLLSIQQPWYIKPSTSASAVGSPRMVGLPLA